MIICICHRVSDRDIARAVGEGCNSFESLQDELCVATACGACHDCAQRAFHAHAGGAPAAAHPVRIAPRAQVPQGVGA